MARNRKRSRGRGKGGAPGQTMKNKETIVGEKMMPPGQIKKGTMPIGREGMPMGAGMASPGEPEEPEPNVSPEEQEMLDAVLTRYYDGMYKKGRKAPKEGEPSLIDQVHGFFKEAQNEESPISFIDVLGNVTAQTVMTLEDKMEDDGIKVTPDVLMHAGMQIMEDLAEFSDNAGYHEYTEDEINGAATQAFATYGAERQAQGRLDTDAIKADYETMVVADREGRLDEVLPGASRYAEKVRAEGIVPTSEEQPEPGVGAAAVRPIPGRIV